MELCNLEYSPGRGSCIVPHLDDTWLWGERLVTINMMSETYLSFTPVTGLSLVVHIFANLQVILPI